MREENPLMQWLLDNGFWKWDDTTVWWQGRPVPIKEFEVFYNLRDKEKDNEHS